MKKILGMVGCVLVIFASMFAADWASVLHKGAWWSNDATAVAVILLMAALFGFIGIGIHIFENGL